MDLNEIVIGILLLGALITFNFYAFLAVRHAARFRYLSRRCVFLTLFFVTLSALLIAGCLGVYINIVLASGI
ncbi:hypothetical protein IPG41_03920 [Candidatus Peregrinibacteria bacterium]|nr:MAG: hypothetical protein IPG41_03920 [Candidatus Peregrinibacteria bacterium]